MYRNLETRIRDLESKVPSQTFMSNQEMNECKTPRAIAFAARVGERMEKQQRYAAMSTPQKIAAKKRELAERENTPCNELFTEKWRELGCRLLKIDIQELEGASADVIETQRTAANEWFRGSQRKQ